MTDVYQQRDAAGRFGGRGTYRAKSPAPTTLFTSTNDVPSGLRATLSRDIDDLTSYELT